jgi:hypothetical protein
VLDEKGQYLRTPHPRRHLIRKFIETLTIGLDCKGGLHNCLQS